MESPRSETRSVAIITISRGAYGGIEELVERLSEELGYGTLSREELLTKTAEAFSISQHQLESALVHRPGLLEGRGLTKLRYIACVQATLTRAVCADDIVYHGEAGHLLLESIPHSLRVRVVAAMEQRVADAMEHAGLARERAFQYIRELDEKRDKWGKWVHGVDTADPALFDLVVNLERIPVATACALIAETVARDFQSTSASRQVAEDLALASEVRARIGLDGSIPGERIRVTAKEGVVTIRTAARYVADADRATALARTMEGVKDVHSEHDAGP
jgi:cytidylate kinase